MNLIIIDDYDFEGKLISLDCNLPSTIALLPMNIDDAKNKNDLIYHSSVQDFRKYLKSNGISESRIEKDGDKLKNSVQKSGITFLSLSVFICDILQPNGGVTSLFINLLSSYIYDVLKNNKLQKDEKPRIELNIVSSHKDENGEDTSFSFDYKGTVEDLDKLPKFIQNKLKNGL